MATSTRKETKGLSRYVRVEEVMELCNCSESHAYRIMRDLNEELRKKGYVTTAGRVSRKYLMERLYI